MRASIGVRAVCTLAAAVSFALCGAAQGPGAGRGFESHMPPMERAMGPMGDHGRWWNDPHVIEKLKLTDEQRKAMDAILLDHREKLIDLRAALEKAELAMQPLVQADQPNESAILAQIDKVAQARADLEKANARFLLALRAKLTPEQWKAMQDLRRDHRDGRMWRQGDRRGERRNRGREDGVPNGPGSPAMPGNGDAGTPAPGPPPPTGPQGF